MLIAGLASFGIGGFVVAIKATTEVQGGLEYINTMMTSSHEVQKSFKILSLFIHWHSLLKQLS